MPNELIELLLTGIFKPVPRYILRARRRKEIDKIHEAEKEEKKVPRLNLRNKISKEKADKIYSYLLIALAIIIGLYFVLELGILGLWISPWLWVSGFTLTAIVSYESYRLMSRLAFKRLLAFILLCVLMTMPLFAVFTVVADQSTAQGLSTLKEVDYFKTLLGKSYNYTELIVWENKHLSFTYGNIDRNTDPVKIYKYSQGRCEEFATLYAELCISQGYRCRIVHNIFNDHVFNEVLEANGTWIRVDASLNDTSSRAIGYPMFFEKEPTWSPPILALAFENSSIVEVTSTYRSDGFTLFSPLPIALLVALFAVCLVAITKFLIFPANIKTKSVRIRAERN